MELQVALEAGLLREPGRVDRLDLGEMLAVRLELGQDRLATAVAEQIVILVETERRCEDRVVADEPDETGLDDVVEALVERPGTAAGAGRGSGATGCGSVMEVEPPARQRSGAGLS